MADINVQAREPMSTEEVKEQLKESIERTREDVVRDVRRVERAIQKEVREFTDWREWVRSYPLQTTLGALLIGIWLGRKLF